MRLNFDEQFQKDFLAQKTFQLLARCRTDLFQLFAAFANKDCLLTIAFTINRHCDFDEPAQFLVAVHDHRGRVGNFLARCQQNFLTYELRCHEAFGVVGQVVFGKRGRSFGQGTHDLVQQDVKSFAFGRGYRNDLFEIVELAVLLHQGKQLVFGNPVNLVEQQIRGSGGLLHQIKHLAIAGAEALRRVHNDEHKVSPFERLVDLLHHSAIQAAIWPVDARSVNEDDLSCRPSALGFDIDHALNAVARGLWLGRDDGYLFADQRIEQRALARVRAADDGNKTGTESHGQAGTFGWDCCLERLTRSRSTRRSVDSSTSKRRPLSSMISPGRGMRPARELTKPPIVATSFESTPRSKRSCKWSIATLPLITYALSPSRTMSLSSSCSSRISPTISSTISSRVTTPATAPYSSITIALWMLSRCISRNNSDDFLVSGTNLTARTSCRMVVVLARSSV